MAFRVICVRPRVMAERGYVFAVVQIRAAAASTAAGGVKFYNFVCARQSTRRTGPRSRPGAHACVLMGLVTCVAFWHCLPAPVLGSSSLSVL
jgi:hypothetical protein